MNLFYDKAAHKDWSGGEESAGCYLFMSALVQYAKDNNKEFDQTPLEVYPDGKEEDMLRKETRNFAGRPATIFFKGQPPNLHTRSSMLLIHGSIAIKKRLTRAEMLGK